jgi:hypothetical protein
MNRSCSHPNYENLLNTLYREGSPHKGIFEARRGRFGFRENRELKPPLKPLRRIKTVEIIILPVSVSMLRA